MKKWTKQQTKKKEWRNEPRNIQSKEMKWTYIGQRNKRRNEWINEPRNIPSKEKRNGWKRTKKHTMIRNDEMNEKNKEIKEQWRKKYTK